MLDIQFVLVDIDGTLLNDEGFITDQTLKAIKKLKQQNILFGIATGRTPYAVKKLVKDWNIEDDVDVIMGFNGGSYLDMKTMEIFSHYELDGPILKEVFEDFKDFKFNAGIYDKESFHVLKEDDFVLSISKRNQLPLIIDDLSQYFTKKVEKMLLIGDKERIDEMENYSKTIDKNYRAVRSTPFLLEILNPELSKAKGIMKLCQHYNVDHKKVLTFGDELNDYEMIKEFIGVAMDNGNPVIKDIAKYVTDSNNDDGIGHFLEKYVLKK